MRNAWLVGCWVAVTLPLSGQTATQKVDGANALRYARQQVAIGTRVPGSLGHRRAQQVILGHLKKLACTVEVDAFSPSTPKGTVEMKNLIARFPGLSGRAIVVSGHYDTKEIPGIQFLGANDGASSAGLLMELARKLSGQRRRDDVYLVWLDGEEAFGEWSDTNGVYGSRHLSARWSADATLRKVKALINVDMIGDKDLGILQEYNSSPRLIRLLWSVAQDLGYGRHFLDYGGAIEDDHVPFARRGVEAIDLIDFEYGPSNRYWHTAEDSLEKLSAASFQVVGDVVLESIRRLEQTPSVR